MSLCPFRSRVQPPGLRAPDSGRDQSMGPAAKTCSATVTPISQASLYRQALEQIELRDIEIKRLGALVAKYERLLMIRQELRSAVDAGGWGEE